MTPEEALYQYNRLIWREVRRWQRIAGRANEPEDLYQVGAIALLGALADWDPARGKLITLALPRIYRAIQRHCADTTHTIRIPVHKIKEWESLPRAVVSLDKDISNGDGNRMLSDIRFPAVEHTERDAEKEIDNARLVAAINQLPDRWRRVLALTYLEEKKTREVARVLGCTQQNVCLILKNAHKKLRVLLEAPPE